MNSSIVEKVEIILLLVIPCGVAHRIVMVHDFPYKRIVN